MSEDRIRVLVVGESPIVRAGLAAAISESDRFEVVGTTNLAGAEALAASTAASAILMEADPGAKPPATPLTPRELDVLRLMADGASNKIIAHKLGISDHTVKFHVTSILSKLNAGTRTEAATLGVRQGLVYL